MESRKQPRQRNRRNPVRAWTTTPGTPSTASPTSRSNTASTSAARYSPERPGEAAREQEAADRVEDEERKRRKKKTTKPGKFQLGDVAFCVAVGLAFASYFVLCWFEGKEVSASNETSFSFQTIFGNAEVSAAVFAAVFNLLLRYAMELAAARSWWSEAVRGSTFQRLHDVWHEGTSIWVAGRPKRWLRKKKLWIITIFLPRLHVWAKFWTTSSVAIVPLLQFAIQMTPNSTTDTRESYFPMTTWLDDFPLTPEDISTCTRPGCEAFGAASLSPQYIDIIKNHVNREPILLEEYCPANSTCTGRVRGLGLYIQVTRNLTVASEDWGADKAALRYCGKQAEEAARAGITSWSISADQDLSRLLFKDGALLEMGTDDWLSAKRVQGMQFIPDTQIHDWQSGKFEGLCKGRFRRLDYKLDLVLTNYNVTITNGIAGFEADGILSDKLVISNPNRHQTWKMLRDQDNFSFTCAKPTPGGIFADSGWRLSTIHQETESYRLVSVRRMARQIAAIYEVFDMLIASRVQMWPSWHGGDLTWFPEIHGRGGILAMLEASRQGGVPCLRSYGDSRDFISKELNAFLFRLGVEAARARDKATDSTVGQTIEQSKQVEKLVYEVNWPFYWMALGVMVTALLFCGLALRLGGWKDIGRVVSMSPIELAKAFRPEVLQCPNDDLNGSRLKSVLDHIGKLDVRYALRPDGFLTNSTTLDGAGGSDVEGEDVSGGADSRNRRTWGFTRINNGTMQGNDTENST